ncbi:DNA polymerase-3 subunit delta' [Megasphaera paucivorans]|uniref:DNA polymerase-3 subunit delta n=1 Tax=Megasphaera paucivorans TaxID=349095 RepID=A0A1G9XCH2_9FIRM|nr:DNA polymerase-3 subunit delta' [Megasphaera paucivorans]
MVDDSYFAGIIGHDKIKKRLRHLIEIDRMPHAIIFTGSSGLGKTCMAVAAASAMVHRRVLSNWEEFREQVIVQDRDDVYFLSPMGSMLKVDQFRQLQEKLMLMGELGSKRICLIDHVETINKEFANRMLKILEEPPQDVCFFLVTNQIDILLPTIISRCAVFSFEPVEDKEMADGLIRLRGGTFKDYEQAILWGGGNVRTVLDLLDGKGAENVHYALDFLRLMAKHACPYAKWLTISSAFTDKNTMEILRWTGVFLRDMMVIRSGSAPDQIRLKQYRENIIELLPFWSDEAIVNGLEALDAGTEAVFRHVNTRLVWDYVTIRFQQSKGGI